MSIDESTDIRFLKGVGASRASTYEKLGVNNISTLLTHYPRDYIDLRNPFSILEAPIGETCAIKATLVSKSGEQRIRKGLSIFKLFAEDATGLLEITIFNAIYLVKSLTIDQEYIFYGRADGNFTKREINSPQIFPAKQNHDILPIYSQTSGITSKLIARNIKQALSEIEPLTDPINENYRIMYNLGELNASLEQIHFPKSMEAAAFARERFIFEELLILSCGLALLGAKKKQKEIAPLKNIDLKLFYDSLPYAPTKAQFKCINDAASDFQKGAPMNRLIQGDVGSGKTLVAAGCIYFCFENNVQAALMVPTEILAEQHYVTMKALLEPFGIKIELLTGSTKAAEKRRILEYLANGEIDLCIGTHALLTDNVLFYNLQLVITDEQHRFGVSQRAKLSQKSEDCHVLVMSATPIPRTLSLIIYGDLSLSVLDELPPGRKPIETLLIDSSKRARAIGFMKDNINNGQQAYIVCPLIETGEVDMGLTPAVDYAKDLSQNDLKGYSVGLLHGKMKPKEKEQVMRDFKSGKIQALVSTTVVEVGVDVPNATIMFIENAERFGLSQLHQLRGRVGRGAEKSWCILLSDAKGESAKSRLRAMRQLSDGFALAEYDLKLRGPGDFFGFRQHGLPELRVASLSDNLETMEKAQECAKLILGNDPFLESNENQCLRKKVDHMLWSIGDRPN